MDVDKVARTGSTAQQGTSVADPQDTGKLRILITEDDFASRRICLDILMPEMNGHEALKAIRQAEREQAVDVADLVKVIMTTSKDGVQDIAEAFASGCDAYVVKPVDREKLCEEMRKLLLIK